MSADADNLRALLEDFMHEAAAIGWPEANRIVRAYRRDGYDGDPWADDFALALDHVAAAFLVAAVNKETAQRKEGQDGGHHG